MAQPGKEHDGYLGRGPDTQLAEQQMDDLAQTLPGRVRIWLIGNDDIDQSFRIWRRIDSIERLAPEHRQDAPVLVTDDAAERIDIELAVAQPLVELDRQAAGVMAPVRGRREAGTGQGTLERRQPAHGRGGRRRGRDPGQTRDGPGGELIGDTPELVLSSHPRTRSER